MARSFPAAYAKRSKGMSNSFSAARAQVHQHSLVGLQSDLNYRYRVVFSWLSNGWLAAHKIEWRLSKSIPKGAEASFERVDHPDPSLQCRGSCHHCPIKAVASLTRPKEHSWTMITQWIVSNHLASNTIVRKPFMARKSVCRYNLSTKAHNELGASRKIASWCGIWPWHKARTSDAYL